MKQTHVVHTFNADRSLQGTVEELPDNVARSLIRTGRARIATEEEIDNGTAAVPEPADDQAPIGAAAADTAPVPAAPSTGEGATPEPAPDAPPAGKVVAVPKPSAGKAATQTTPTTPSSSTSTSAPGDAAGK